MNINPRNNPQVTGDNITRFLPSVFLNITFSCFYSTAPIDWLALTLDRFDLILDWLTLTSDWLALIWDWFGLAPYTHAVWAPRGYMSGFGLVVRESCFRTIYTKRLLMTTKQTRLSILITKSWPDESRAQDAKLQKHVKTVNSSTRQNGQRNCLVDKFSNWCWSNIHPPVQMWHFTKLIGTE